jgi:regulator of cell morphogenesis and NO signaling
MLETAALTVEAPLGDFVTARPGNARVLEKLGLDYCCGGKRSLRQACAEANLDPRAVLERLGREEKGAAPGLLPAADWGTLPLAALVDDIVTHHHGYLREELPRLAELFRRVVRRHGEAHPELRRLQQVFVHFAAELNAHMFKEEMVLFPAVRELEKGITGTIPCDGLDGPVHQMEAEHDAAGQALREMRRLTSGYKAPGDACASYQALLISLEQLEADMHLHVHKENNVLFPRAVALERREPL